MAKCGCVMHKERDSPSIYGYEINGWSDVENNIEMYFNCTSCINEMPDDVSPAEYANTQMGFTKDGKIQVWCNRHNINVAVLSK